MYKVYKVVLNGPRVYLSLSGKVLVRPLIRPSYIPYLGSQNNRSVTGEICARRHTMVIGVDSGNKYIL